MVKQMRLLIDFLNENTKYYNEGKPHITDKAWDDCYFELKALEEKTGIVYPDSPTQTILFQTVNQLEKVIHTHQMLSLDKTKELGEVMAFLGGHDFVSMCKMDGLTCTLRYENGLLIGAETRGNGIVGDNIFHNVSILPSVPKKINYLNTLEIDGEIISTYSNFERFSHLYKNPRNFAAGSIRLLDASECAKRGLTFVAWDIINDDKDMVNKLEFLKQVGFVTVPYQINKIDIEAIQEKAKELSYPIDGAVFKFNDTSYGKSLGQTAHHFKNAIAYKFYDETYETKLLDIEWNIGRTGIITPVAIFEPVDIEGTTVQRASLHNLSIMENLFGIDGPFVGQAIEVFKANMINPQIAVAYPIEDTSNLTSLKYPTFCPICGKSTECRQDSESTFLFCSNADCEGKFINRLVHFCGKSGLDIKGLSKKTLEKLIEWEWVNGFSDLFELQKHRKEWIQKQGFGEKSVDKILNAIEAAKAQKLENFISAIGIPLIGLNMAKQLAKYFSSYDIFRDAIIDGYDFTLIEGFAEAKHNALHNFDYTEADAAARYLYLSVEENSSNETLLPLDGLTFVITGKLKSFKNRTELQDFIVKHGGKVVSAISSKVNFLINNDIESTSAKNLAAKEIGIPIITEENFLKNIEKFFDN